VQNNTKVRFSSDSPERNRTSFAKLRDPDVQRVEAASKVLENPERLEGVQSLSVGQVRVAEQLVHLQVLNE